MNRGLALEMAATPEPGTPLHDGEPCAGPGSSPGSSPDGPCLSPLDGELCGSPATPMDKLDNVIGLVRRLQKIHEFTAHGWYDFDDDDLDDALESPDPDGIDPLNLDWRDEFRSVEEQVDWFRDALVNLIARERFMCFLTHRSRQAAAQ